MKKLLILCMLSFFIISCDDSKDPVIDPDIPENPDPDENEDAKKVLEISSHWYLEFEEENRYKIRDRNIEGPLNQSIVGAIGSIDLKTDDGRLDVKITIDRDKDSLWVWISDPAYCAYDIECQDGYFTKLLETTEESYIDEYTTGFRLDETRMKYHYIPFYGHSVISIVDSDMAIREVRNTVSDKELGEFLWVMTSRYSFYKPATEKTIWKIDEEYLKEKGEKKIRYSFKDIELTLYWDDIKDSLYIAHTPEDLRVIQFQNHPDGAITSKLDKSYLDDPNRDESAYRLDHLTLALPLGTYPGQEGNYYSPDRYRSAMRYPPVITLEKARKEGLQRYIYKYTIEGAELASFVGTIMKSPY